MNKKVLVNKFSNIAKIQNEDSLRINIYGYLTEIILSKELFKNNKDLNNFFSRINIDHKKYLYASRTLLIAMTIRKIQVMDIKKLNEIRNNTLKYLLEQIEQPDSGNSPKQHKKANDELEKDDYVGSIIKKYSRSN